MSAEPKSSLTAPATSSSRPDYDFSEEISHSLDPHLFLSVLRFLKEKNIYPSDQLTAAIESTLLKTQLVEELSKIGPSSPNFQEATRRAQNARSRKQKLQITSPSLPKEHFADHSNFARLIEYNTVVKDQPNPIGSSDSMLAASGPQPNVGVLDVLTLTKTCTFSTLSQYFVCDQCLKEVFVRAKFYCDIGDYERSLVYLEHFICASPANDDSVLKANWGALCSAICLKNSKKCDFYVQQIRKILEDKDFAPAQYLLQRTYLLHWILMFCMEDSSKLFVDCCYSTKRSEDYRDLPYINSIQVNSPWLLRYVIASVVVEDRYARDTHLKEILKILKSSRMIDDPLVNFVRAVYVEYDFVKAQNCLSEIEAAIAQDFILSYSPSFAALVMKSVRALIFELYCRVYQVLDLKVLSEKLNMSVEDAEKWIVDLLRSSNLNVEAKIDSNQSTVMLAKTPATLYGMITGKAKQLLESSMIMTNIMSTKFQ